MNARKPWWLLVGGKLPRLCPLCDKKLLGAVSDGMPPFTTTYKPCGCVEDAAEYLRERTP